MRRQMRINKFQLLSSQVDRVKLQNDKKALRNSRDFKEITLAITLLAGIGAISLKLIEYFTNHAINESMQSFAIVLISILLSIFFMIFIFLMLKGYLASQKNRNKKIENISGELFNNIFLLSIVWFVILLSLPINLLIKNPIFNMIFNLLLAGLIVFIIFYLSFGINSISAIKSRNEKKGFNILYQFRLFILTGTLIVYLMIFIVPSYLLLGSFSIEEPQQSDRNIDIMTFKIRETGIPYNSNYINLYKMNIDTNIFQYIDNITIKNRQEASSQNKLMRGIMSEPGIWYLNVNASNLSSGNYILHAEVTDDISKKSIFGMVKKRSDKLFYISPKIENDLFNNIMDNKTNFN